MDTKDIPTSGPSDWRREPSERRNAVLGKLAEEASELAGRCARAMIQGLNEIDPEKLRTNLSLLEDEIADVRAMCGIAVTVLELDIDKLEQRRSRKHNYKMLWIEGLPDE